MSSLLLGKSHFFELLLLLPCHDTTSHFTACHQQISHHLPCPISTYHITMPCPIITPHHISLLAISTYHIAMPCPIRIYHIPLPCPIITPHHIALLAFVFGPLSVYSTHEIFNSPT
ncbi:hypothetical protein BsWGS_11133 [Bradybaena similaris]